MNKCKGVLDCTFDLLVGNCPAKPIALPSCALIGVPHTSISRMRANWRFSMLIGEPRLGWSLDNRAEEPFALLSMVLLYSRWEVAGTRISG